MINYTLNSVETLEISKVKFLKSKKNFEEEFQYLAEHYELCENWENQISIINHITSVVLERLEKRGFNTKKCVTEMYDKQNLSFLEIQESDIQYLDNLLIHDLDFQLSLEEKLISAQNKIYDQR